MIIPAAVRALIFDFDGVLADTEALHCAAFHAVAAGIGLAMTREDYFRSFLGLPDRDCLALLCARAGRPLTPAELDELCTRKRAEFAQLAPRAQLYDGVADALRRLSVHSVLAIASGAFRDEIEPILERAGVRELFTAVIGAEDVRAGKPAPDPFLQALVAINRRTRRPMLAADCVVIEDSPNGIIAARAAGMRCIGVTTHHGRAALAGADAVVEHVTQLRLEDFG